MKVKCILSHEKPIGRVFKAGKVYEMDEGFSTRYFVPVKQKKDEIATSQENAPRNDKRADKKKKRESYN